MWIDFGEFELPGNEQNRGPNGRDRLSAAGLAIGGPEQPIRGFLVIMERPVSDSQAVDYARIESEPWRRAAHEWEPAIENVLQSAGRDVHVETIAVAEPGGAVHSLGVIPSEVGRLRTGASEGGRSGQDRSARCGEVGSLLSDGRSDGGVGTEAGCGSPRAVSGSGASTPSARLGPAAQRAARSRGNDGLDEQVPDLGTAVLRASGSGSNDAGLQNVTGPCWGVARRGKQKVATAIGRERLGFV